MWGKNHHWSHGTNTGNAHDQLWISKTWSSQIWAHKSIQLKAIDPDVPKSCSFGHLFVNSSFLMNAKGIRNQINTKGLVCFKHNELQHNDAMPWWIFRRRAAGWDIWPPHLAGHGLKTQLFGVSMLFGGDVAVQYHLSCMIMLMHCSIMNPKKPNQHQPQWI